jgi:hypothetical protein
MRRHLIFVTPLLLTMVPSPAQAFPSDAEIGVLSQRFCELQSMSSPDYTEVFNQEVSKWVNNGSLTQQELADQTSINAFTDALGEKMINQMIEMCPDKLKEMDEQGISRNLGS